MILSGNTYRELKREVRESITATQRDAREALTTAVEAREAIRSHAVNCVEHNQRIESMLREGRDINERRHNENQNAIGEVHGRVTNLGSKINLLLISFLASALMTVIAALGAIVAHKWGLL